MRVEWVTDRLPDNTGWYLITVRLNKENFDGRRYIVREEYFRRDGKWQSIFPQEVVAWMEIPEPWVPDDESDDV